MAHSNDILTCLSQKGYRITPQRMMILNAINGASGHISAEEIYESIRQSYPGLNISTVYRTLELLQEMGFVTETDMGDGRIRFHSAGHERHHHLVCSVCGKVIDLDEEMLTPLAAMLNTKYGFRADLRHMTIFGRCKNCC
ncbi:MAG: transcriptional repressor [Dehalococcoidia bacterium]|nr:transcriptional repressor [Dehalococcoidia bacterium]